MEVLALNDDGKALFGKEALVSSLRGTPPVVNTQVPVVKTSISLENHKIP